MTKKDRQKILEYGLSEEALKKYEAEGHTAEEISSMIDLLKSIGSRDEIKISTTTKNLDRFHLTKTKNGEVSISGVFDAAIFDDICHTENICIIGGTPWFYNKGVFIPDNNGAYLKTAIRNHIYPQFIKSNTIKRVYDLFMSSIELQKTPEQMNQYPAHWINFKDCFYDPITGAKITHSPIYLATNQLPHNFVTNTTGDFLDKWLQFAIPSDDDREMLLEYCGLCMTRDTRQQKFLILKGMGGTGKSTLLRLLTAAIGENNVSNISLMELSQRFASYGLMGKLLNCCADLEVGALEDASVLKKCLGEDTLRAEQKGKDAVSFKSYAKLIFSTNELPLVKAERTNGFYRRLLAIEMNQIPKKVDPALSEKLLEELPHFIELCLDALASMYVKQTITESDNSKEIVQQLWRDSDSVQAFIDSLPDLEETFKKCTRGKLYELYAQYCIREDRQPQKKLGFFRTIQQKGFLLQKHNGEFYFILGNFEKKTSLKVPCFGEETSLEIEKEEIDLL